MLGRTLGASGGGNEKTYCVLGEESGFLEKPVKKI